MPDDGLFNPDNFNMGQCLSGQVLSCDGTCISFNILSQRWQDGFCDAQTTSGEALNCAEFAWDGGDCCASTCDANGPACHLSAFACQDPEACELSDGCQSIEDEPEVNAAINSCFAQSGLTQTVDSQYAGLDISVGEHCYGTNQQDITDVEQVVFLGDSITVGTLPTPTNDFYRVQLAEQLANTFGLEKADEETWEAWKKVNHANGTTTLKTAGDFSSCAGFSSRTSDLMYGAQQIEQCLPEEARQKRTLVVLTTGGIDMRTIAEQSIMGAAFDESLAMVDEAIAHLQEAINFIKDPENFPNGAYVVFANLYEYTDGTGDLGSCENAGNGPNGAGLEWPYFQAIYSYWQQEAMKAARETGADMIFLYEHFCGHGFNRNNPNSVCFAGEDAEPWFDMTCIHPNALGHGQIAEMFYETIVH